MRRYVGLAIAWTCLCISALGSVLLAVYNHLWPLATIQTLITLGTGVMAYFRWTTIGKWKIGRWLPPSFIPWEWKSWGNGRCNKGYFLFCPWRWSYFRILGFDFTCEPEPGDKEGWEKWHEI